MQRFDPVFNLGGVKLDATLKEQGKAADAKATGDAIDQAKGSVTASLQSRVAKSDIADNLTTNDATKVLSAKQGIELSNRISGVSESLGKKLFQAQNDITANTEDISDLNTRVNALESNPPSGGGGSSVELDTTLTQSGKAADAKVVGDKFNAIVGKYSEGLEYDFVGESATEATEVMVISLGDCTDTDIIIPPMIGNKRVVMIADSAFDSCENIKSVYIPDTVHTIDSRAFIGCRNLQSITIPDSVQIIGRMAFYNCSGITNVKLPSGIKTIPDYCFGGCSGLTSLDIPRNVTNIKPYAFYYCTKLKRITVPNSVTSIGLDAFGYAVNSTIYCEATSRPSGWDSTWNSGRPVVWGAKLDFGGVNESIKELGGKSLDKVTQFYFSSGDIDEVDVRTNGIWWYNNSTEVEFGDGDSVFEVGGSSNTVPIVAGNNVTFEQDGNVVKINAEGGGGGGGVANLMTPITYAELKALRDSSQLTAGMFYRITDYVCTTTQADTRAMSNKFDIIVQALSENTLSEIAKADYHVEDGDDTIVGTWVFNDEIEIPKESETDYDISYTATDGTGNVEPFRKIYLYSFGDDEYMDYIGCDDDVVFSEVYTPSNGWANEAYKTITITEEPTDAEFIAWLKANATKQAEGSGEPKFKPEVLADDDGTLVEDAIVAQYYIFDDFDDAGGDATEAGYKSDDKFIAYDYLENYDGDIVPVIYKTDMESAAASPDEYGSPDYEDTFYYVGTEVLDGVTYDKWRKINQVDGNGMDWQGHGSVHVLTNVVISGGSSGGTSKSYFKNSNLPAWGIKYCLDNDTTRFAWALDGLNSITRISSYDILEPFVRFPAHDSKEDDGSVRKFAWRGTIALDWGSMTATFYSLTEFVNVGDVLYNGGDAFEVLEVAKQDNTEGKGVIYYMKDEFNNECPYDFKNIQFKRTITLENGYPELDEENGDETWVYTFCATSYHIDNDEWSGLKDGSLESPRCHQSDEQVSTFFNNSMGRHIQFYDSDNDDYKKCGKQYLNNNVFFGWWEEIGSTPSEDYPWFSAHCCSNNTLRDNCIGNTLADSCCNNTFGEECRYNKLGGFCSYNTFGSRCEVNVAMFGFRYNKIGIMSGGNYFGSNCVHNELGISCNSNVLGEESGRNRFSAECSVNTVGFCSVGNTFGYRCNNITAGDYLSFSVFGNGCNRIIVAGDNINYIEVGSGIANTTITPVPNANYQQIYRKSGSTETFV